MATHVDRAHIHNHIIYNSTTLDCTRKFKDFHLSGLALVRVSDIICLEHRLSVIVRNPYTERKKRTDYPKKTICRDTIREAVDAALAKKPKDFDELLRILSESLNAIISGEKKQPVRSNAPDKSTQSHVTPQMQFLIDIQAKILEGKGGGHVKWAKIFNLKQAAEALLASLKADEVRLQEIAVLKTHIINYAKSKDVFARYKASGYSRDFYEAHREALTLRRAASTPTSIRPALVPLVPACESCTRLCLPLSLLKNQENGTLLDFRHL